jgi:hypothetical protein
MVVASDSAAAQGSSPNQLQQFIDKQIGGIHRLMVSAHDGIMVLFSASSFCRQQLRALASAAGH